MIEAASLSPRTLSVRESDAGRRALLISWVASLPCQADITANASEVKVFLSLTEPSTRTRPARIGISDDLFDRMQTLAARTYVPDSDASRQSGAGAGAMELD